MPPNAPLLPKTKLGPVPPIYNPLGAPSSMRMPFLATRTLPTPPIMTRQPAPPPPRAAHPMPRPAYPLPVRHAPIRHTFPVPGNITLVVDNARNHVCSKEREMHTMFCTINIEEPQRNIPNNLREESQVLQSESIAVFVYGCHRVRNWLAM